MNFIDYHSHIIPNVDDGCETYDEAIEIIRDSVNEGITTIIATPHYFHRRYETSLFKIKEHFRELQERVNAAGIKVDLLLGQEICYSSNVDLIKMLDNGELLTIAGTKYILLEFHSNFDKENVPEIVYDFTNAGYKVILAHVDRYDWMDPETIINAVAEGALIQINAASLLGEMGFRKKHYAKVLLRNNLVSFISSDSHSFRKTHLGQALKIAKKKYNFENPSIEDLRK